MIALIVTADGLVRRLGHARLGGSAYLSGQAYLESRFDDALAYNLRVPATNPPDVLAFVNREEVLYYRGLIQLARGDVAAARASRRGALSDAVARHRPRR